MNCNPRRPHSVYMIHGDLPCFVQPVLFLISFQPGEGKKFFTQRPLQEQTYMTDLGLFNGDRWVTL